MELFLHEVVLFLDCEAGRPLVGLLHLSCSPQLIREGVYLPGSCRVCMLQLPQSYSTAYVGMSSTAGWVHWYASCLVCKAVLC